MTYEINTSIKINATPEQVWKVFTQFENYGKWKTFIQEINGDIKEGNKINIQLDGMNFKPKVLSFKENKEFIWQGHLPIKGIFDGRHSFEFKNNGDGTTTFIHSEKFSGILIPLLKGKLEKETKPNFIEFNKVLKEKTEK